MAVTAYVSLVGLGEVAEGDGLAVHGADHVHHLAQHVLEVDSLLALQRAHCDALGDERERREELVVCCTMRS